MAVRLAGAKRRKGPKDLDGCLPESETETRNCTAMESQADWCNNTEGTMPTLKGVINCLVLQGTTGSNPHFKATHCVRRNSGQGEAEMTQE